MVLFFNDSSFRTNDFKKINIEALENFHSAWVSHQFIEEKKQRDFFSTFVAFTNA